MPAIERTRRDRTSRPDAFFALKAQELLQQGAAHQAVELCKRGLIYHPEHATGYVVLAQSYFALGEQERGLNVLRDGYRRTGSERLHELVLELSGGRPAEHSRHTPSAGIAEKAPAAGMETGAIRTDSAPAIENDAPIEAAEIPAADEPAAETVSTPSAGGNAPAGTSPDAPAVSEPAVDTIPTPLIGEDAPDGTAAFDDADEVPATIISTEAEAPAGIPIEPGDAAAEMAAIASAPESDEVASDGAQPGHDEAGAGIDESPVPEAPADAAGHYMDATEEEIPGDDTAAAPAAVSRPGTDEERIETGRENTGGEAELMTEHGPVADAPAVRGVITGGIAEPVDHVAGMTDDATPEQDIAETPAYAEVSVEMAAEPDQQADDAQEPLISIAAGSDEPAGTVADDDAAAEDADIPALEPRAHSPAPEQPVGADAGDHPEETADTAPKRAEVLPTQQAPAHAVEPPSGEVTHQEAARAVPGAPSPSAGQRAPARGASDIGRTLHMPLRAIEGRPADAATPAEPRPRMLALHTGRNISHLRSSNLRLIPGLEFAPLRHEDQIHRQSIAPLINEPMPMPMAESSARERRAVEEQMMPPLPPLGNEPEAEGPVAIQRTPVEPPPRAMDASRPEPEEPTTIAPPAPEHKRGERRESQEFNGNIMQMVQAGRVEAELTPLEELARRLESARIPAVEEVEQRTTFEPSIVSETLANILAAQGAYQEALKAFQTLARQKPARFDYYQQRIREMKWYIQHGGRPSPPEPDAPPAAPAR